MSHPVIVELNAECHRCGPNIETIEIPRDRWDAMTPAERVADIEESAQDHGSNNFGWGWHIPNETDMKMTEENNDV